MYISSNLQSLPSDLGIFPAWKMVKNRWRARRDEEKSGRGERESERSRRERGKHLKVRSCPGTTPSNSADLPGKRGWVLRGKSGKIRCHAALAIPKNVKNDL